MVLGSVGGEGGKETQEPPSLSRLSNLFRRPQAPAHAAPSPGEARPPLPCPAGPLPPDRICSTSSSAALPTGRVSLTPPLPLPLSPGPPLRPRALSPGPRCQEAEGRPSAAGCVLSLAAFRFLEGTPVCPFRTSGRPPPHSLRGAQLAPRSRG